MNWITQLTTILNLLPAIITAIKAIEEAIPGQGKGEQKLAAVREILEAVSSQAGALWPQIQTVIGILVGLFNRTGVFQKAA
mgnify:CR=1 FL=1